MDVHRPLFTAEEQRVVEEFRRLFFLQWERNTRHWRGTKIVKYPTDMMIYQMIIHERKPEVIIETGSYRGGASLFFASLCDFVGKGEVLSIDMRELPNRPQHPRLTYLTGRTTAWDTLPKVIAFVAGRTCMVTLDSDHRRLHVQRELRHYSPLVTPGQYLVVEDTFLNHQVRWNRGEGPLAAIKWFLERNHNFVVDPLEDIYLVSMNPGGWLRRL